MKKILFIILPLIALSCNKVSRSDLQGEWTVDSVKTQVVTSTTDSGWQNQLGAMSIFVVGEELTINKYVIVPCPSAAESMQGYDDYTGEVKYSLSGDKLIIPDQHYSYQRQSGDNMERGETMIQGCTFAMTLEEHVLTLSGTNEELDNLGNVKRRTNTIITLSRQ